jgi:hypothetical protein
MEDEDQEHGAADPTRAFEDLRAEVSVLRRAVEALPDAWEESRPPDYSPDMGRIDKTLKAVVGHLVEIEKHPALLMTPEQHRAAIANAGGQVMREGLDTFTRATQEADRERRQLAGLIGVARTQDQQFKAMCWAGGIALAVGLILSPFVAGLLPFGLNTRVAALVMRDDRWDAGEALMAAGNPDAWRSGVNSWNLVRANQDTIAKCSEAVAKSKHDEHCTITVPATPAQ